MDIEDLDALIDGGQQSILGVKSNDLAVDSLDVLLLSEYCEEEKRPSLPPVPSKLAAIVTSWLRTAPKKEKIKELFKDALLPDNVEGLTPVRINELLYQKLPARFKHADLRLRGQNTYFTRGLGPLISLLDKFLKAQVALHASGPSDIKKNGDNILIKDVTLDLDEMRKLLDVSVRLLCAGNGSVLQCQKHQLKSFLAPHYHYLLKPTNKVTTDLLGPDIDQCITKSNKLFEATKRLQVKCPSWGGWRGGGHGSSPQGAPGQTGVTGMLLVWEIELLVTDKPHTTTTIPTIQISKLGTNLQGGEEMPGIGTPGRSKQNMDSEQLVDCEQFGGCLHFHLQYWQQYITLDKYILQCIRGARIPFKGGFPPKQHKIPREINMTCDQVAFVDQKLLELEASGCIRSLEVPYKDGWVSNIFVVPKNRGLGG